MNPGVITHSEIVRQMDAQGHRLFVQDHKPYNLNLIGIRTVENVPDAFNDWFVIMWHYGGCWNLLKHRCTTDPGLFYLSEYMLNPKGTAQVKAGQYPGMWKYGYHKGYRAWQQKAPVTVLRDFNRDGQLNPQDGSEQTGIFGINGHRAKSMGLTTSIGPYGAGCVVHADSSEFSTAMHISAQAIEYWANSFTFTLLEEKTFI